MAPARLNVKLELRFKWWLPHYLAAVALVCNLFGGAPNMERVAYWVWRGVKIYIVGQDGRRIRRIY